MTRSVSDCRCDRVSCPGDLCCHGDCHCTPAGSGPSGRSALRLLAPGVAALAALLVCAGGWILTRLS